MAKGKQPRSTTAAAIRYARERHGWTRLDLADRLASYRRDDEWDEQRVARLELDRSKADPDALVELSEVLGVSIDFLVRGVGQSGKPAGSPISDIMTTTRVAATRSRPKRIDLPLMDVVA